MDYLRNVTLLYHLTCKDGRRKRREEAAREKKDMGKSDEYFLYTFPQHCKPTSSLYLREEKKKTKGRSMKTK